MDVEKKCEHYGLLLLLYTLLHYTLSIFTASYLLRTHFNHRLCTVVVKHS